MGSYCVSWRMAEILFIVLSCLNGMSGYLPHVGYSQTGETSWKRSGAWSADTSQQMFQAFVVLGCLGHNLADHGLLFRPPICSFAASSVEVRHKTFEAGYEFQLEITDISYNKRHLRCFRIICVRDTAWYIPSNPIKILLYLNAWLMAKTILSSGSLWLPGTSEGWPAGAHQVLATAFFVPRIEDCRSLTE